MKRNFIILLLVKRKNIQINQKHYVILFAVILSTVILSKVILSTLNLSTVILSTVILGNVKSLNEGIQHSQTNIRACYEPQNDFKKMFLDEITIDEMTCCHSLFCSAYFYS